MKNHDSIKTLEQQIIENLENLGCSTSTISFPIKMDGEENRWDAMRDGKSHSGREADSFKVVPGKNGGLDVIYCFHRDGGGGCFTIGLTSKYNSTGKHYLQRKGFDWVPNGVRLHPEGGSYNVVAPLICADTGETTSCQTIFPGGFKKNSKNSFNKNSYFIVNRGDSPLTEAPTFYVAEGLATAMSVHMATGCPCAVSYGKVRMVHVAKLVKAKYPHSKVILAIDAGSEDDIAAQQKKKKTNFPAVAPRCTVGDDFNDLMQSNGLEEVKKQLLSPPSLTILGSNEKVRAPALLGGNGTATLEHAYLFAENCQIFIPAENPVNDRWIKNASYAKKHMSWFEQHPERCIGAIVYDPKKPPRTTFIRASSYVYNMYTRPSGSSGCATKGERLRELLLTGCRYAADRTWLEQWIAWQVQRPGQLLDCHPLLASAAQRTGKTTLANVVGAMIGLSNYKELAPEDATDRHTQHYASESTLIFVDEFNPSSFASPETSRITKRMLTQVDITAPKKYINSYTAPRTANYIFATNRLQQLHYCAREERIKTILWREDKNFQYNEGSELHALSQDTEAVDWLRNYFKSYELPADLKLRKGGANAPSEAVALTYHDDPYGQWLATTNIGELPYVTNEEIFEKATGSDGPAADLRFDDPSTQKSYYRSIASAFKRMGWFSSTMRINGKVRRVYFNGSVENWKTQKRPAWVVKPTKDDDQEEDNNPTETKTEWPTDIKCRDNYRKNGQPLGSPVKPPGLGRL